MKDLIIDRENILDLLSEEKTYTTPRETYSPFYSNIGLILDENSTGIDALWLHYNRFSRPLWNKLIDIPAAFNKKRSRVEEIVFGFGQAKLAFYGTDRFLFSANGIASAGLFRGPAGQTGERWRTRCDEKTILIQGYSANGDARDPDRDVCFLTGVRALKGALAADGTDISAYCDADGDLLLAFAFECLTIDEQRLLQKLANCPETVEEAAGMCAKHLRDCVSEFSITVNTETERRMLAKALHGLLFNLTKAPGDLSKHVSSYPNRGEYPTHFLWDTCFQNLAYELMNGELVKDFLLQFNANQRSDGKYPQFLCSTWARPAETQPALIGWAVTRFAKSRKDEVFLSTMLASLEKNNGWWLSARMTSCGLVSCPHGLETGQDDSPRFDDGGTLAADMNSYLLHQMRCTAELARRLGEEEKAAFWEKKAEALSEAMLSVLYCGDDNLFYDVSLSTGAFIKIVSPVSLLPLWAGVSLPENRSRDMIERYLLDPKSMFGDVPFPSVAYDQESYQAEHWWRGPTWLPEAWLMLETLDKFGYVKEKQMAQRRLYEMLLKDVSMHELFNSQTGEGLGSEEQGWTCAIFIKLCKLLNG
ncbi:MAG: hypothetical protein IJK89_10690 [Clostridia bacterium]|nr:hypothetical protein [Clostridia bacterium]